MEMRISGKRLGGVVRQAPQEKKAPLGQAATGRARQDRLEVSKAAVEFLREQAQRVAQEAGKLGAGEEEKEESGLSSLYDHFQKQMDIMDKCAKISASISAGDRVPPEDLRYLKQHDMNAYRLAMATRKPKKDPKDQDSVLSEEDIKEMESTAQVGGEVAAALDGGGAVE